MAQLDDLVSLLQQTNAKLDALLTFHTEMHEATAGVAQTLLVENQHLQERAELLYRLLYKANFGSR